MGPYLNISMTMEEEVAPLRRLRNSLTTGNLWLYVLSLLSKKRMHAYVMREQISKKFSWKPGLITSYVVLYKLEAEGLIKSGFEGRRNYYEITEKGRETLRKGKKYLRETASKI